jgi:chaperone required for assembly of F1-ATPase
LGESIAGEWNAQSEAVDLTSMPRTSLAFVAIDAVPASREEFIREIIAFAEDDLICYFAASPAALIRHQEESWAPLLAWAKTELDLAFTRQSGVIHVDQLPATLRSVAYLAGHLDDFRLAGLVHAAKLFGSAILALALMRAHVSAADAAQAALLDETFQLERWGQDAETEARRWALEAEAVALQDWFAALEHP